MDKSSHLSADEFGKKIIRALRKLKSNDEDTMTEEGYNLAIEHAVNKVFKIY